MAKVLLDGGVDVIKNLKELTTYWTAENGFDKVAAPEKQYFIHDQNNSVLRPMEFVSS